MEWQHPQWLYLILPLAAAWLALSLYSRRRRRRAAGAFVAQAMWSRILPVDSRARFWAKLVLRETALVTGLIALAGPRYGTQYEDVIPRGSDLYVLIDVSRSMLAEDVPPSRLGRAKADVAALVNRLEGERVGLIAFAGQAVVKCPLTVDYDAFRRSLDELDPGSAPRGGTAIGDAIRKALEVFQARADRDQAILLITDGDDQQSYPLEAAAVAAERHVTIFTVGLGDADHGARIPQGAQAKSFLEYKGQQVWSKLDGSLLKEIALKTTGVYVPVGTRAYDLGELYAKYLQGRRGSDEQSRKRIRRADQFQIFLALALLALLADLFTRPYPGIVRSSEQATEPHAGARRGPGAKARQSALPTATALALVASFATISRADNPAEAVRDGLRWYGKGEFDKARDKFAAAREQFDSGDAGKAAIAAFDQACASHRKGDVAQAKEWYLKAGLAHDKGLAASAHFNLGTLAAEEARRLAGEHPETVAAEKRPEILDQLKAAVASFRHCLELQPDNSLARRDIELLRQWVKYYSDQWLAHDREKRRQETNLVAFLEFLIETQRTLRESVKSLPGTAPADAFAEPKRLQEELQEEIPPLKEKIKSELTPPQPAGGSTPPANSSEIEQGIKLLQGWAIAAGDKMSSAALRLDSRQSESAAADQQAAIDELEKIWDAVIPFHPLLAHDLADQTKISQSLAPAPAADPKSQKDEPAGEKKEPQPAGTKVAVKDPLAGTGHAALGTESEDLAPLKEMQERTLRRTQLLKLKAEAELARVEKSPPPEPAQKGNDSPTGRDEPRAAAGPGPKPVDPKQIKAGYQKAIELAPGAALQMERAVKSLNQKDAPAAYPAADEARKLLEEIQKAQPKQDQQEQKKKDEEQQKKKEQKDQEKKDEQKKDQQKNDPEKKDEQNKDQQKDDQEKKDQQKKDQQEKKQDEPKKSDEQKQDQQQVSRDRIEEALRKVRERQQEKRERDRRMKVRLSGSVPVEKDW
jgi:Ca-activated chloride channel homolog